jgi:DNA-binding NtrC family response regulator
MVAREKDGPARVLVIDDDEAICGLISKYLQHLGHSVEYQLDGRELDTALSAPLDVVLLDVNLPDTDGFALLERVVRERPDISVIMLTASTEVENVVEAMRRGAFDYLSKPIDFQRLNIVIRNACEHTRLRLATDGLRAAIIRGDGGPDLICGSQAMSEVISLVERVASSRVPVLVHGEAGSGKEVVARRVHARSRRKDGPFVAINCTALPPDALEMELFGSSEDGTRQKEGRSKLDEARGGTLFLDEVGELGMELQTRLLRVLQESDFDRARGGQDEPRFIAATSRHLPSEVSRGHFRADLFYRLNVFSITVPPLRDRRDDIPALARYSLARFAAREAKPPPQLSSEATELLMEYDWPGNVRELNNVIERAALLCGGGTIRVPDLPEELRSAVTEKQSVQQKVSSPKPVANDAGSAVRPLQELEREMMVAALKETQGNVSEAARRLGIGRATFYRRAQRYGLTREDGFPG